jgi:large subunit ribosomal protein L13
MNTQTHTINAEGQAVGRVATQVAMILMGKHKPTFSRDRMDTDKVEVINASKLVFKGRKLVQKDYYHHTQHAGGIKRTPMAKVFQKDPANVVYRAVLRMLPNNRSRVLVMKRLDVKA